MMMHGLAKPKMPRANLVKNENYELLADYHSILNGLSYKSQNRFSRRSMRVLGWYLSGSGWGTSGFL
jgi:hypothetical protein